jgi:hypothetical protein
MTSGRFALAIVATASLLATSCLVPYVYPKLSYVPGCPAEGPKVADIHAFRVDLSANEVDVGENGEFTLTEIVPRPDGCFPAQGRLSLEYGYYVCGPLNFNVGWLHDTRVRLYSRGFRLVELKAWESAETIRWQVAEDWSAREKAVDDLLRRPAISGSELASRRHDPERGSSPSDLIRTKATVKALLFAAAEYEEIAAHAATPAEAARLQGKARGLSGVSPAAPPLSTPVFP